MKHRNWVWITWKDHLRTRELANAMNAELIIVGANGPRGMKHFFRSVKTIFILRERRNDSIIVQNPSRILAAIAVFFSFFWKYPVVVDRHTNFRLGKVFSWDPRIWFLILCSNFSLKYANLTIVTNQFLKNLVEKKSGTAFVLPDKIPSFHKYGFSGSENGSTHEKKTVVFICTFADDEPYESVIQAGLYLDKSIQILITGNHLSQSKFSESDLPLNVRFTGFLPDDDYGLLLKRADVVMDFTTLDWCLVCGGYEALSLSKPFVTSDTQALRDYFEDCAIYSDHSPSAIAESINIAISHQSEYEHRSLTLKTKRMREWDQSFSNLMELMKNI